jgi:hypothetical protein
MDIRKKANEFFNAVKNAQWHPPMAFPQPQQQTKSPAVAKMQEQLAAISRLYNREPSNKTPDGLLGPLTQQDIQWFKSVMPAERQLNSLPAVQKEVADLYNVLKPSAKPQPKPRTEVADGTGRTVQPGIATPNTVKDLSKGPERNIAPKPTT